MCQPLFSFRVHEDSDSDHTFSTTLFKMFKRQKIVYFFIVCWFLVVSESIQQTKFKRFRKSVYRLPSSSCAVDWTNFTYYTRAQCQHKIRYSVALDRMVRIPRGGGYIPAGWNPFGYFITPLGLTFLEFDGSLDSDVGRFLASLKSGRKKRSALKEQWLEIVRVSKTGQSMRILRRLDDLIDFCIKAGLLE
jgi:hypothetical protein